MQSSRTFLFVVFDPFLTSYETVILEPSLSNTFGYRKFYFCLTPVDPYTRVSLFDDGEISYLPSQTGQD